MLLGITGTDGAGKGVVVSILMRKYQFVHYSSRFFIEEELAREGLPATREQLRLTANKMRAAEGDDVVVARALRARAIANPERSIIESIRTLAEVETLRAHGGVLLAVDAEVRVRYKRVIGRGSSTDQVSFADFVEHELLESNDTDPHGMQRAKVMDAADYTIMNNGTLEELEQAVDAFMLEYSARV